METKWRIQKTPTGKFCITDGIYISKHYDSKYGLFEELQDLQVYNSTYFIDLFGSLKILENLIKLNIPNLSSSETFPTLMEKINYEISLLQKITDMLIGFKNISIAMDKGIPNFLVMENGDDTFGVFYFAIESEPGMFFINESPRMYSKAEARDWLELNSKQYFPDIFEYTKIEGLINDAKNLPNETEIDSLVKIKKQQQN